MLVPENLELIGTLRTIVFPTIISKAFEVARKCAKTSVSSRHSSRPNQHKSNPSLPT